MSIKPPSIRDIGNVFPLKNSTPKQVSVATQTEDELHLGSTTVALQAINGANPVKAATPSFDFKYLDFDVIQIEKGVGYPPELPEMKPYLVGSGESYGLKNQWLVRSLCQAFTASQKALYWTAASTLNWVRTSFYRTENEILRATINPANEIRVSSSWFFGGSREKYYMLNHRSALHNIFINTPKWLWYEGITSIFTSEQTNTLKVYKILPYILKNKLDSIEEQLSARVEDLAKQAITVLNDEDYKNRNYLTQLESELKLVFHRHLGAASELVVHKQGEIKTVMKKIQIALHNKIEKDFPDGGNYIASNRDKIDAIKVFSDRFFKIGDTMGHEAIETHNKIIDESLEKFKGESLEAIKGRIYILTRELLERRSFVKKHLENFEATIHDFNAVLQDN